MDRPTPPQNPYTRQARPVYDPAVGGVRSAQAMLRRLGMSMPNVQASRRHANAAHAELSTSGTIAPETLKDLTSSLSAALRETDPRHHAEIRRMYSLAEAVANPDGNRRVFWDLDIRSSSKRDAQLEALTRIDARASYWTPPI